MIDSDLLKLLGPYGFGGVVIFIAYKLFGRLADRGIQAVDNLTKALNEHTKVDLEHHADVKESIAEFHGRMDAILELTPVRGTKKPRTNPHGIPVGYYGPRKGTQSDE